VAARAQFAALRAQLNPHFLFNTLHSLTVLIRASPALAEEAVERLGALLRFALRHSGAEEISLGEELDFVRDYLALEALRLGERLRVEIVVDAAILGVAVPPLCLQPLVENAIRHGLSPKPEGGTLRLSARAQSGSLSVLVSDDGVGAGPECSRNRGSGLASLSRRIGLGRGDRGDAELEITTGPGRGFAVGFTLPIEDAVLTHDGVERVP
jgi:sensor histidine kinase YesM